MSHLFISRLLFDDLKTVYNVKKYSFLFWAAALMVVACRPTEKPPVDPEPELVVEIPNAAPFTLSLSNPQELAKDSLQSYALGEWNGYWLIVGGRTNGFHGTGGQARTFPTKYANTQLVVYNRASGQRWSAPIPAAYSQQLSSTNMPFLQDGTTLWIAGGYGCKDNTSKAPCYNTYPYLTAINVEGMVKAISSGQTTNLGQYVSSIEDNRFQVTGGVMRKLGNNFYLVMGQNYDTIYVGGINGQYTEEIRRFNLALNNGAITVSNYQTWTDPQFHRRDLNVAEAVRPNGQPGINVWAGVFQPNAQFGLPWPNPVLIDQDAGGNTSYRVDTSFSQQFNAYDCGHVLLFDNNSQTMFTVLIGGIANAGLDANGKVVPPNGFLPWSKYVSTIAQFPNGVTREYPQASPLLPGFIGGSADVILAPGIPIMPGTTTVIDYAKLPAGDNLVGWLYGGIYSTAEQTNAVSNPSFASATIYEVHLNK